MIKTRNSHWDKYMHEAYMIAAESPDPSTQNGALLLTRSFEIIGGACNDFPGGVNQRHWHGEKAGKYARVVHSEVGALLDAARRGHSTTNSVLVCPWAACSNCAKHIAAANVAVLVRTPLAGEAGLPHWHDDCLIGDEILREAGVSIIEVEPLQIDFKLRRNGREWPYD